MAQPSNSGLGKQCSSLTRKKKRCLNRARSGEYCYMHAASRGYRMLWVEHVIATGIMHFIGVVGFGITIRTLLHPPPSPEEAMCYLADAVMEHDDFDGRLVEGINYDKRPLDVGFVTDVERLSRMVEAEGVLCPRASVPLSYYYLWQGKTAKAVRTVKSGLEKARDSADRLHLFAVGVSAVVVGKIRTDYPLAKAWCDESELEDGVGEDASIRRNIRYNRCTVLILQVQEQVGAYGVEDVVACFESLPREDLESYDPYEHAVVALNFAALRFGRIQSALPISKGKAQLPNDEQRKELLEIIDSIYSARLKLKGHESAEVRLVDAEMHLRAAEIYMLLEVMEPAYEHAHAAVRRFRQLNDPCRRLVGLQLASRIARAQGNSVKAAEDVDDAIMAIAECPDVTPVIRAALILSKAAQIIDDGTGVGEAVEYLWNHADERPERVFQERIMRGILKLCDDFEYYTFEHWGGILCKALEVGLVNRAKASHARATGLGAAAPSGQPISFGPEFCAP